MKKKLQMLVGIGLGIALVWYLFKDTDWPAVGLALRDANWWWVGLSFVMMCVTFVTRVIRWGYIVRTAQPVSFRAMFSATQIGFLGNFTLPARAGEAIRALVLARLTGMTFSRCFGFVALDRVTDLFGLVAVMLVAACFFNSTEDIVVGSIVIGPGAVGTVAVITIGMVLAIIAAFVGLYLQKNLALRLISKTVGRISTRLSERLQEMVVQFADGMHIFRSVGDMSKAIAWSLITWTVGILCYFCVLEAFGIHGPWYLSVIVMACLAIAISMPSAPGFLGAFHAAVVAAVVVVVPDTDLDVAKTAALIAHAINLLSIVLTGGFCLYTEKLGLLELQRQGEQEEDTEHTAHATHSGET